MEVAISLARMCGQSCDGSTDYPKERIHPTLHQKFIALLAAGILAVLGSFADASPTDPGWLAGIYDNADYDEVVELLADGAGASTGQRPDHIGQGPVEWVSFPELSVASDEILYASESRGPPVGACDVSADARQKSSALSTDLPRRSGGS